MEGLISLVWKTYYSHVTDPNDTIKLMKIIFKDVSEERICEILSLKLFMFKEDIQDQIQVKEEKEEEEIQVQEEEEIQVQEDEEIHVQEEEKEADTPENLLDSLRARQLTGDQRSQEWLLQRVNYITASVSAACAGLMGAGSREAQLLEKASYGSYRTFTGGYHTDIGNIFEDITANHYGRLNNTVVHDFRLIPHDNPEYSFLGASTDGVSGDLNNIEIKTLAGRPLDHKIKKEYYHQMQHQMSCLGLSQTHFLEAKYDTFRTLKEASDASRELPYGIVLEFYSPETKFTYLYSPDDLDNNGKENWEMEHVHDTEPGCYIRTIYWRMTGYQMKVVKKDPQWIIDMGPSLKQFWKELAELRKDPAKVKKLIQARETKKQIAKGRPPVTLNCML